MWHAHGTAWRACVLCAGHTCPAGLGLPHLRGPAERARVPSPWAGLQEEVQRDQERANQRVQAQAQQPPPAPAAARAQQQEPSASSRPVAVEAASADGFVFPATAAAQRQAGHTHHTHGGGGHGNGHPNSVSSAASRRQHAQAQAAGAAPGPRPEGAAAAEAQQHSRGNEVRAVSAPAAAGSACGLCTEMLSGLLRLLGADTQVPAHALGHARLQPPKREGACPSLPGSLSP